MSNYGPMHMPEIKLSLSGGKASERSTVKYIAEDSAAVYLGSFVSYIEGSTAAPTGVAGGVAGVVQTFADDNRILGFVVNITKRRSNVPIWEESSYSGTVTAATGELPLLYTFASSNDDSGGANEMVEVMPILATDILEVSLWGASTISVDAGTATGSDLSGYAMSVNTTYPFSLLESTASTTFANLDFVTCAINGDTPDLAHRVYVQCMRSQSSFSNAD